MPKSPKFCKNHPQETARRTCYYCKEPICPRCQHHYDKHIFCGRWHFMLWKAGQLIRQIKKQPQTAMLLAVFAVSVLLIVFYINIRVAFIEEQLKAGPPAPEKMIRADTTAMTYSPFMADSTRLQVNSSMQFRIAVWPGAVIAVQRDGQFTATVIAKDSMLQIDDQRLYSGPNHFALWMLDKQGKSTLIDSFTIHFRSARLDYLSRYVTRVSGVKKVLALTFDGGSLKDGSAEILDILKKNKVYCTIFLTGTFIKKYPDLVRRMVNEGHEIGNHSYNHPHLTNLELNGSSSTRANVNRAFIHEQLQKTDSMFYAITRQRMAPFWRAPFGEINKDILLWAAEAGYKHIGWSQRCDTWDWVADTTSALYRSNGQILDHVLTLEKSSGLDGKILLMHLGTERKADYPYLVLEDMIQTLKNRGYRFLKISELLKKKAGKELLSGLVRQ